jgi:1,6-anhydro-N-acetylmuramate kinase
MQKLERLIAAPKRLGIGLMSGTSLDGMDAALVEIEGAGIDTKVKLLEFCTLPYTAEERAVLLEAVMGEKGGSRAVCCLNTLIGAIGLKVCLAVCEKAGIAPDTIDFVGSHGQTIYHIPDEVSFGGTKVRGTLQVGEAAIIAEGLGCVVVSAGTNGTQTYDKDGAIAAQGRVHEALLAFMRKQDESYLNRKPPKTTGREVYNDVYVERLLAESKKLGLSFQDTVASVTFYTADTIRTGLERFCPNKPDKLIIGGGGANNPILLRYLKEALPDCAVYTNDELGYNSDAKEAIAFAVMANEALHGICNNAPAATGAAHPVVMGKISL